MVLARKDALDEASAASPQGRTASPASPLRRRVVITGVGLVAPNGIGKAAFWTAVCSGRSVMGPPVRHYDRERPLQCVGEITNFHAEDYINRKLVKRTDRMTHFALTAVQEALLDAGLELDRENSLRMGAVIANALAGVEYVIEQVKRLYQLGPNFMSAHTALAWLHVASVGRVSVHYGLKGYCKVPINDTCGGLDALGQAYQAIVRDAADILIAGGTEAPLSPFVLRMLDASSPSHRKGDSPCYRPFDLRADGVLIAEGAGICILEEYEHAIRRGARIYGEIVGYAQTCAPGDLTPYSIPDAAAYIRALELALAQAEMLTNDIACVFPDGRAIPAWDAIEAAALREFFGSEFDSLPCTVPRTQFGHTLSAAGAIDTICALLTLKEHLVPPTINCETPNPRHCPPGLVRERNAAPRFASQGGLVCARGLGGSHAVLVLKSMSSTTPPDVPS